MGEALLRRSVETQGLDVGVASAGVRVPGLPVDPEAVRALAGHGLDISGHRPRQATREMLREEGEDLIITMTREHVRDVVSIDRAAWPRTFSLVELVRRARAVRPGSHEPDWAGWLAAVGEGRTSRDLMLPDRSDDIDDPYGMSLAAHQRAAEMIAALLGEVTALVPFEVRGT
jgi:protein-tyrosine phosphatase